MLKHIIVAACLAISTTPVLAEPSSTDSPVQLAQDCGWFAIFSCSTRAGEVQRFINRTGYGFMIDSSSSMFPNFRPGYYCAADGPMSRREAQGLVNDARGNGAAPTAYVKSSC
jgi:hypothetical protein